MSQFNDNSYAENDCEEELAGGSFLTPILPTIKPSNGSLMDRGNKKVKRLFDKKENIAPKRVCTEESLTILPEASFKRGKSNNLPMEEAQKTILYTSIPRDYKYRFSPSQVRFNYYYIYLFIDLDISML